MAIKPRGNRSNADQAAINKEIIAFGDLGASLSAQDAEADLSEISKPDPLRGAWRSFNARALRAEKPSLMDTTTVVAPSLTSEQDLSALNAFFGRKENQRTNRDADTPMFGKSRKTSDADGGKTAYLLGKAARDSEFRDALVNFDSNNKPVNATPAAVIFEPMPGEEPAWKTYLKSEEADPYKGANAFRENIFTDNPFDRSSSLEKGFTTTEIAELTDGGSFRVVGFNEAVHGEGFAHGKPYKNIGKRSELPELLDSSMDVDGYEPEDLGFEEFEDRAFRL